MSQDVSAAPPKRCQICGESSDGARALLLELRRALNRRAGLICRIAGAGGAGNVAV